ncbi:hypothetical protein MferCBS31731_006637 [Microsporum ferrugineum]
MSSSLLRLGQVLHGNLGRYVAVKELQDTACKVEQTVIIKGVSGHPRVQNERDILKRFQSQTPFLRPLIDEIKDRADTPVIVLKHLDDHLLNASIKQSLNRKEIKYVSGCILKALSVLHDNGYVHADVKLDNIFVNYKVGSSHENRFADIKLGDLGGSSRVDSALAREGTPVGAPIWSSPEVIMETPWNTATDIWSLGAVLICLIYGGDFNIFRPATVSHDHEEYGLEVLKQQFRYFGPFPAQYQEIAGPMTVTAILYLMQEIPRSKTTPFHLITEREVSKPDKEFISKIMKMDWRDRPTVKQLLKDKWFDDSDI